MTICKVGWWGGSDKHCQAVFIFQGPTSASVLESIKNAKPRKTDKTDGSAFNNITERASISHKAARQHHRMV